MDVTKLKQLAQPVLPLDLARRISSFEAEQWSFVHWSWFKCSGLFPVQSFLCVPLPSTRHD